MIHAIMSCSDLRPDLRQMASSRIVRADERQLRIVSLCDALTHINRKLLQFRFSLLGNLLELLRPFRNI